MRLLNALLFSFNHFITQTLQTPTITQQDSKEVIENLLTSHPVLDGHNDLPYVIRECLSNTIYDGRYNFSVNLAENPQSWQREQCIKPNVQTDYPRIKEGHLGAQLWSVYVDCNSQYKDSIRQTVEQIDLVKRLTEDNKEFMQFCGDEDCVRNAWAENKFVSL